MDFLTKLIGQKVANTRVVPLVTKIVVLFAVFLLVSNLVSNYINLVLNQGEQQKLTNRLLVKDLKELYGFASNQYDILEFSGDMAEAVAAMEETAGRELQGMRSAALGLQPDGTVLFWASKVDRPARLDDQVALGTLAEARAAGVEEGKLRFKLDGQSYFSVYKWHPKWEVYLVRAEEENEFLSDSRAIFARVSLIIAGMTIVCLFIGVILLRRILRFVHRFTTDIMRMQDDQKLDLIDLTDAPNDDVTYLGASFNSLSSTINNLLVIFRRFVTKDVAQRAYSERQIKLEGTTKELTILFSDIKSFTYMTETLGNDIIDVLNLHYDRAIRHIHASEGIVGSIIGDALLAVFGTMDSSNNKSVEALEAAFKIQEVAEDLRAAMRERSDELIRQNGALSPLEQRMLKAVLVEVGVGLDGGAVFYGNIGSYERMTNTVIGDNVNSSSRLEGLTRIYQVPVVCSEYIRDEALAHGAPYRFLELDLVQVKGKVEGKRIYWPVPLATMTPELEAGMTAFSKGLKAYYDGDWAAAGRAWKDCRLPLMEEFNHRLEAGKPDDWNGIWAMRTK